MKHLHRLATLPALFLLIATTPGWAAWLPDGNPVSGLLEQRYPGLAPDLTGGAYVTWENGRAFLQRLTAEGDRADGWANNGSLVSMIHGDTRLPVPVADGAGGVYVVWYLSGQFCYAHCFKEPAGVWIQHMTATGTVAPGWPADGIELADCDHAGVGWPAYEPSAVPDGRGGVLIAWGNFGLHVQAVAGDGSLRWGWDGVRVTPTSRRSSYPAIVSDGLGGAFVFWGDYGDSCRSALVFGQHISNEGAATWGAGGRQVSAAAERSAAFVEGAPPAVPDGSHGAIVAWADHGAVDFGIHAARVTLGGELPWRGDVSICRSPGTKDWLRIIPASGGGAILAWRDSRAGPGRDVYAQRIDHGGRVRWTPDGVPLCTAPGTRGPLGLANDGGDGAYLAWGDTRPEGEIFGSHLTGAGTLAAGWPIDGAVVSRHALDTYGRPAEAEFLAIAGVRGGVAMVAWQDTRAAFPPCGCEPRIDLNVTYASLLEPHGPAGVHPECATPALASHVPEASPAPTSFGTSALNLRPTELGRGGTQVLFDLTSPAPARLELFDVAGRRVWTEVVRGQGAHQIRLTDEVSGGAGVYFLRLLQAGREARARVLITR
jgi:hypothetical protein